MSNDDLNGYIPCEYFIDAARFTDPDPRIEGTHCVKIEPISGGVRLVALNGHACGIFRCENAFISRPVLIAADKDILKACRGKNKKLCFNSGRLTINEKGEDLTRAIKEYGFPCWRNFVNHAQRDMGQVPINEIGLPLEAFDLFRLGKKEETAIVFSSKVDACNTFRVGRILTVRLLSRPDFLGILMSRDVCLDNYQVEMIIENWVLEDEPQPIKNAA